MDLREILSKTIDIILVIAKIIFFYLEALYRQIVPISMKPIDGEVILVTGATGGIGREICKCLVESGNNFKIILWDLNLQTLKEFSEELKLRNSTVEVFVFAVDISVKENIEAACKEVNEKVGAPTILFNNAGIIKIKHFLQLTDSDIEKTVQVNLMSHLWIIRMILPKMIGNNHGRIVNICSFGGLLALPFSVPYFLSKFAVNGYTEALKCELELFHYDGIHVTTVYPYFVQTPLIQSLSISNNGKGLPPPMAKFLHPVDVAKSAVNGMRREHQYVYCPSSLRLAPFFDFLIPRKLVKMLRGSIAPRFEFKDQEANKKFKETYLDTLRGGLQNNIHS